MNFTPNIESDHTHFDFMHRDESALLYFRKHGINLFFALGKRWIPFTSLFAFVSYLEWQFWLESITTSTLSLFLLGAHFAIALFCLHWFFLLLIMHYLSFMMVTNKRIIELHKTVFMREDMNEISFDHIRTVRQEKHGILQNILHYGTLRIDSTIDKPIRMHYVPHPEKIVVKLGEIHGEYIGQKFRQEGTIPNIQERRDKIYSSLQKNDVT